MDINQRQAKEDRCLQIVDFEMVTKKARDYKRNQSKVLNEIKAMSFLEAKIAIGLPCYVMPGKDTHTNCFEELQTHALDMLFCSPKRLFGI